MSRANIPYPARLDLARLPTPIQPLPRFSVKLGLELYIKRDDLTGAALSGNKIRKLEFVMAEVRAQGADTVLTCGGAQSNHCRATAIAAAILGLKCRLLLRTPDPANPPPIDGNILLDRMAGAEVVWITPDEYQRRDDFFVREAETLKAQGFKPYIIPEGASDAVGAWGYIHAMEELIADIPNLPGDSSKPVTVVHACGSGGTASGLILGAKLTGAPVTIATVNVSDDRDYFIKVIGDICEPCIETYGLDVSFDRERDINIIDGYVGRGYALSQPEELAMVCELARTEGIFLDPVYTGKAFYGMLQELTRKPDRFGPRIIFIHTGGIFGLFPKASEIAPLL